MYHILTQEFILDVSQWIESLDPMTISLILLKTTDGVGPVSIKGQSKSIFGQNVSHFVAVHGFFGLI